MNTQKDLTDYEAALAQWLDDGMKSLKKAKVRGKTQADLARRLKIDRSNISKMSDGKQAIHPRFIPTIAEFLGMNPPQVRSLTSDSIPYRPAIVHSFDPDTEDEGPQTGGYTHGHWQSALPGALPEIDVKLGAGEGIIGNIINLRTGDESISGHKVIGEWVITEEFLRHEAKASPGNTIVMEVIGDSMVPTYQPGDRVLVDLAQTRLRADTVYAISDGDSEPQIKRLQRVPFTEPTRVKIISDNPALETFEVDLERLAIIGRVCGLIARR